MVLAAELRQLKAGSDCPASHISFKAALWAERFRCITWSPLRRVLILLLHVGMVVLDWPWLHVYASGRESNHPKDWQTPKPSGRSSQLQSSDVAPDTTVFCSGEGLSSAFSSLGLHTIWAQDAENIVLASINLHANWVRSFSDNLVFWFLLVLGLRAYTCPHDLMLL